MSLDQLRIGFLGAGKMGAALIQGALNVMSASQISFYELDTERAKAISNEYGVRSLAAKDLVQESDWIVVAVKPQQFKEAIKGLASFDQKVLISIMAGTSLKTLSEYGGQWVRVMPNTPLLCQEAMIPISTPHQSLNQNLNRLFESMGKVIFVPESQMDILTALSGSGPAFFYRLAEAMINSGIDDGLSQEDAQLLVSQTMLGAAKMLQTQGKSASELIQDVSSPNGTTVAGLSIFDRDQIDEKIQAVIQSAKNRSIELSKGAS